jgi:hypothetical protein
MFKIIKLWNLKKQSLFIYVLILFFTALIPACSSSSGSNSPTSDSNPDAPQLTQTAPVEFSAADGTYSEDFDVSLSSSTDNAIIYYTLDGSVPNSSSIQYTAPIAITGNGISYVLKAVAVKDGLTDSEITSAEYTISYPNHVYIDPSAAVNGDGSVHSPFQSWSHADFQPGYSYVQKRGTIAREELTIDTSGTAQAPITIGAYGVGEKPIIQGSERTEGWTPVSGTIYSKTIDVTGGGLGMVAENGTVLTTLVWQGNPIDTFVGASPGSFSFDYNTSTVYVWTSDSASPDNHEIEVSRRLFGIYGNSVEYVDVEGVHVRYVSLHGMNFPNSSHISITDCLIEKLGGAMIIPASSIYAGNGIEFGDSAHYGTVRNTTVSQIFDSGVSPQIFTSNQSASNFIFSDLTIDRCGFAGVEVVVLYNSGVVNSSLTDVLITNVTVTNSGRGFSSVRYGNEGRGIKVDAYINGAEDSREINGVEIKNCTVSGSMGEGIFIGGKVGTVTIDSCDIVNNNKDGILAQEAEVTDMLVKVTRSVFSNNGDNSGAKDKDSFAVNVPSGNGFELINNTFVNPNRFSVLIWSYQNTFVLTNNLFHSTVFMSHLLVYPSLPATAEIDNNFFTEFNPGDALILYDGASVGYDSAAAFNAAYTFASNNTGSANPGLNSDNTIQSPSSPLFQSGKSGYVEKDRNNRDYRNPPSIGAYEFY